MIRRTLLVLAALAAAPALAAEEEFVVVPNPALPGEVPPGSREDQLLWRDARDAMVQGNETVRKANMALYDLYYARLDLSQLEPGAAAADTKRLGEMRARLDGPAKKLEAAMPRGPIGRCRYEILYFEQSMAGEPGTELAARLPQKRGEARRCRDEHRQVIAALGPATKELRAALEEIAPDLKQRMATAHKESPRTTAAPPPGSAPPAPGTTPAATPPKAEAAPGAPVKL